MTKTITLTVPLVLLGAAQLLRKRKWSRGLTVSPEGDRMCMVGAIETFLDESDERDPVISDNLREDAINQVTRTIWRLRPELGRPHVTAYNDHTCKSADEAAAMLEAAASAGLQGERVVSPFTWEQVELHFPGITARWDEHALKHDVDLACDILINWKSGIAPISVSVLDDEGTMVSRHSYYELVTYSEPDEIDVSIFEPGEVPIPVDRRTWLWREDS